MLYITCAVKCVADISFHAVAGVVSKHVGAVCVITTASVIHSTFVHVYVTSHSCIFFTNQTAIFRSLLL